MAFVGIFSAGIPSSILGRPSITPVNKDLLKPSSDLHVVGKDFRTTAVRLRLGVKKTKDTNGIR
jgi:hypothetical protein